MTKVTYLPRDLIEEVLSRVPLTSLKAIRLTCKRWNILSKNQSFTKKQIGQAAKKKQAKEFHAIMTMHDRFYLMSINLNRIHKDKNVDSCIKQKGKLINLPYIDRVVESKVFHCNGLLLCITSDISRLVVWNPYCGKTNWIEPRNTYHLFDNYALGYEIKNNGHHSYKILRYLDHVGARIHEFEIFDFESNSWRVLTSSIDELKFMRIPFYARGVSLKGNTYSLALENVNKEMHIFLLCFDFTTERFGQHLPLPSQPTYSNIDTMLLSTVREEKLAVLYQRWDTGWLSIWISNKIEPNAISWSELFLTTWNMKSLKVKAMYSSFFVDEEKKVAVVFDKGSTRSKAYIFGEDGYNKQVDFGGPVPEYCFPSVRSYVPTSTQI